MYKLVSVSVCYFFRIKNRYRYRYVIQFWKSVSVSVRLKSSKSVRSGIGTNRFKVNRSIPMFSIMLLLFCIAYVVTVFDIVLAATTAAEGPMFVWLSVLNEFHHFAMLVSNKFICLNRLMFVTILFFLHHQPVIVYFSHNDSSLRRRWQSTHLKYELGLNLNFFVQCI